MLKKQIVSLEDEKRAAENKERQERMKREMAKGLAMDGGVGGLSLLKKRAGTGFEEVEISEAEFQIRKLTKEFRLFDSDVEKMKRNFDQFDTDKSDTIDFDEFLGLYRTLQE